MKSRLLINIIFLLLFFCLPNPVSAADFPQPSMTPANGEFDVPLVTARFRINGVAVTNVSLPGAIAVVSSGDDVLACLPKIDAADSFSFGLCRRNSLGILAAIQSLKPGTNYKATVKFGGSDGIQVVGQSSYDNISSASKAFSWAFRTVSSTPTVTPAPRPTSAPTVPVAGNGPALTKKLPKVTKTAQKPTPTPTPTPVPTPEPTATPAPTPEVQGSSSEKSFQPTTEEPKSVKGVSDINKVETGSNPVLLYLTLLVIFLGPVANALYRRPGLLASAGTSLSQIWPPRKAPRKREEISDASTGKNYFREARLAAIKASQGLGEVGKRAKKIGKWVDGYIEESLEEEMREEV